jgi:hypothetical protein
MWQILRPWASRKNIKELCGGSPWVEHTWEDGTLLGIKQE